jgi:hypothetical protein
MRIKTVYWDREVLDAFKYRVSTKLLLYFAIIKSPIDLSRSVQFISNSSLFSSLHFKRYHRPFWHVYNQMRWRNLYIFTRNTDKCNSATIWIHIYKLHWNESKYSQQIIAAPGGALLKPPKMSELRVFLLDGEWNGAAWCGPGSLWAVHERGWETHVCQNGREINTVWSYGLIVKARHKGCRKPLGFFIGFLNTGALCEHKSCIHVSLWSSV